MSSLRDRLLRTTRYTRCAWEMHTYQDYATDWLWERPFSAAFIDTGLGKTVILLTLIDRILQENIDERILIIAPVRVAAQTWPNEFPEWEHTRWMEDSHTVIRAEDDDPEVLEAYRAAYEEACYWHPSKEASKIAGKAATKKKEELRIARARDGKSIHVINREALTWLIDLHSEWKVISRSKGKVRRKRVLKNWPYKTVIIDESSSFKDHTSARFKALCAVRSQGFITRLHELTATPAAEGYMGVFAQMFLLDLGECLGANITSYREEFFTQNAYSKKWKIRPGAEEIISDRIAHLCLVMKTKDYRDEEEPLFLDRKLKMTEDEEKQYKRFSREFVLTLKDGTLIEAETAASLSAKLLQLASGAVYETVKTENDEGEIDVSKITHHVHDHKIEDLRQLQEELGDEPLLVAYWYKSSLARLRKAFPDAVVMDKSGKVAARHGPWNSGKIKMLLVHPAGVGHGLNMQYGPGHDLYMFDSCWSYELFYQLYCRLHRQGQRKRVRVHLPQMIGTNDELVVGRLREKEDAQEILFRRIRAMWKRMKEKMKARNV